MLFVCQANICRSPLAEGIFRYKVQQAGLQHFIQTDSAGVTSTHVGELPHSETLKLLAQLDPSYQHVARTVHLDDYYAFDYMLAMDQANLKALSRGQPTDTQARISLLMDFVAESNTREIEDPCFTGRFAEVYRQIDRATQALLQAIRTEAAI